MSKRIVILGAGESGTGAAMLAKQQGFDVFVSDKAPIKEKYKALLNHASIVYEENTHTESNILNADEIIISPGIPAKAPLIKKLKEQQTSIISEIEFAGRYTDAKMICITGSNGKTTTTLLTHHLLNKAGIQAGLAGNVGKSLAMQLAQQVESNTPAFNHYVLELSSFQLDDMHQFKADVAVLLNITPDHLDRYNYQFQNYIDSKFRIIQNQQASDAFIYCIDDEVIVKELSKRIVPARQYPFSIQQTLQAGAYLNENQLIININQTPQTIMSIQELALQGKHNIYNSMAAGIVARLTDVRKELIRESLSDFQNVEHRLEFVAKVHGVEFINDSKATNVNSTWYALESMENPVVLILGGVDKGNDYNMLMSLVKQKVKAIVCLGEDNTKLLKAFGGVVPYIFEATSAKEAVALSLKLSTKGDTVLLSPACASFDLFENYEDRGHQFKAAVKSL